MKRVAFAIVIIAATVGGCHRTPQADPPPQQVVAWQAVGSWSGHGNRQTESFRSDSGGLRVHWKATLLPTPQAPARGSVGSGSPSSRSGKLRVTAHSAISGRLLEQVVDQSGPGNGVGYVNQDPHVFYLMVESEGLQWTLSVEEAIAATVPGR